MLEQVVLVNEMDQEMGLMEKMEAHEKALLHRAFSVFILNIKASCFCNNAHWVNTIVRVCGPIPVAVTLDQTNLLPLPQKDV